MPSTEVAQRSAAEIEAMDKVNAELTRRLEAVPDSPDDGGAGMFMALLNVTHWKDLDAPWSAQGLAKYIGHTIMIDLIHKMPSDLEDGPSWYLVAHGVDTGTGEEVTFTTSSVATMIQLIIAHTNGWLPLTVIPRVAERKTKRGYYPQHLEIVAGPPPVREAAAA